MATVKLTHIETCVGYAGNVAISSQTAHSYCF